MTITSSLIRAIMASNSVTAPFAQLWSDIENGIENKKTELFCKSLREELNRHEDKISKYLNKQSDSIDEMSKRIAALESIVDGLAKEYERNKIVLLSKITANCMHEDSLSWEQKYRAIDSFKRITSRDLDVLRSIGAVGVIQVEKISHDIESLIAPLCKLSSVGLIAETVPNLLVTSESVRKDWKSVWKCKYFEILSSGRDLLKIIE